MLLAGLPNEDEVGLKSDIYSLALILMELCGHHHPFYTFPRIESGGNQEEKMRKILAGRPSVPRPILPRFPTPLALIEVFQSCLDSNPTGRMSSRELNLHHLFASMDRGFTVSFFIEPTEDTGEQDIQVRDCSAEQADNVQTVSLEVHPVLLEVTAGPPWEEIEVMAQTRLRVDSGYRRAT